MDVAATLLAAAGIEPDQAMDGIDLLDPSARAEGPRTLFWRTDFPTIREDWRARTQRAVRRGDWKYLWDGGFQFLYDLTRDPSERDDLGYRHPELVAEFRELSKGDW